MTQRPIARIHPAVRDDIADLTTWRALPTQHIGMIDPFLFLNHHGAQVYAPHNRGLPFGPHPHRGFETVTFILDGDIAHRDSGGHESIIDAGGVQWMTAGRGLVHSETSSEGFKRSGGPLEILQLWVNLPARLKMTTPGYTGLQQEEIARIDAAPGVRIALTAGAWHGQAGPIASLTGVTAMTVTLDAGSMLTLPVPRDHAIFFYVVRGAVMVDGTPVRLRQLVEFAAPLETPAHADPGADAASDTIALQASAPALILFCHARPLREPVVSHGPFVMNTREEIGQAIADYQAGKFNASTTARE